MKKLELLLLVPFAFAFILSSGSCKKDLINTGPLYTLPAATQTGANTFACLLNGQAFIPNKLNTVQGAILECRYDDTGPGYFEAAGGTKNNDGSITDIILRANFLSASSGQTLSFQALSANASASCIIQYPTGASTEYDTNSSVSGQLTITGFNAAKAILSGTFYFNAVNSANDTVKITGGRFDMRYYQ